MSKLVFLLPGSGDSSLSQEECCWYKDSRQVPTLALNAIAYLRRTFGCDAVKVYRPLDTTIGTRAMIFSWIFGDELESAAKTCSVLIANPSSTAATLQERFPAAHVIPARDVFTADTPMDFSPLSDWPHSFTGMIYQASSGCPHQCPYCPWAHRYQRRCPEMAAAEIHWLLKRFPATAKNSVAVLCNEITGNVDWLSRFCHTLGDGVTWLSDANIRNTTRAEIELAAQHGLVDVTLGVEALDDSLLQSCGKGHTVEDAFRVFRWCRDLGIRYRFSLRQRIGETPAQLDRQIANLLAMRETGLSPYRVTIGPMTAWPGNTRWEATELHGSRSYPRWIKPLGPDAEGILERWKQIQSIAAELISED